MERLMNVRGARIKAERPAGKVWPKPKRRMKVAPGSARGRSADRRKGSWDTVKREQ